MSALIEHLWSYRLERLAEQGADEPMTPGELDWVLTAALVARHGVNVKSLFAFMPSVTIDGEDYCPICRGRKARARENVARRSMAENGHCPSCGGEL